MGQARDDEAEEWFDQGNELFELGRYEEAIISYDQAIEFKPDKYKAFYNRGVLLVNLGQYSEAITSFDRVIEIKPDEHEAWSNRGIVLDDLGRYEEAITSFDQATELNPDGYDDWYNRGITLGKLGQYLEAISSYNRAAQLNPFEYNVPFQRGIALDALGMHQEAIESFDIAIKLKPDDCYAAWAVKGISLCSLERYKEAISSYDQATQLNPDDYGAWMNQGIAFANALKKPEEALQSFNQAIRIRPLEYWAWHNRGIATGSLQGYKAEIDALVEAFEHIDRDTNPEGWGFLKRSIGRTHYEKGINQLLNYQHNHQSYYDRALISYNEALTILTHEKFPELRLETLIDTAKVYLSHNNTSAANECQTEALTIWLELINAQPTPEGKKRLYLKYNYLLHTQVDLSILDGEPIRALEIAEFDKNKHLEWFLYSQEQQGQTASLLLKEIERLRLNVVGLQYSHMRQLLAPNRAIIYWHLSPDHLTTFILHPHNPNPQVLTNSSQQLRNWLKDYDTDNLDTTKLAELGDILEISEIDHHLDDIEHLILIPHRDLHRLPLHSYWQNLTTTYLPSFQIGLNLKAKPQLNRSAGFLLVESPDYSQPTKLKSVTKSFEPLTNPEIEAAIIAHLFQPKTTIHSGKVSKDILSAAFNIPHTYGHFNGHAYHDSRRPQDSSLVIDGGELTCQDLAQIDLTPYYLIGLSACETGITTHQSIDTEYVGLVSAFLSRGTNYVVSTLWSVKDLPSSLLMMAFYLYLKDNSAPLALYKAAHWLKTLTHAEEAEFHRKVHKRLPQNSAAEQSTARITDRNRKNAEILAKEQPEGKPYSDPKCWAAFTISGWG